MCSSDLVRLFACLFSILTPLWIVVDLYTLPSPLCWQLAALRLATSAGGATSQLWAGIAAWLDAGITRVILGSAAAKNPRVLAGIVIVASFVATFVLRYSVWAHSEVVNGKPLDSLGIASLLVLISGFGLLAKLHANQFSGWVIVKLVCWLGLSMLAGMAFRRPHLRGALATTAPAGSAMVPVMVPRSLCANMANAQRIKRAKNRMTRILPPEKKNT